MCTNGFQRPQVDASERAPHGEADHPFQPGPCRTDRRRHEAVPQVAPGCRRPYYNPEYITINDDQALRTLPLAATVTVTVIDLDSGTNAAHPIRLADLPAHLNTSGYHEQGDRHSRTT